jgi:DNA-binding HxlR family transcriptional regulator
VPPRVEYALTPLGESLLPAIEPLVTWTRAHRDEIATARTTYDAAATLDRAPSDRALSGVQPR